MLIFFGIFFGAILAVLLLPKKYEAEMKLLMNKDRIDAVVTPNADSPVGAQPSLGITEEDINSEVELLKSRDVLEKVVIACRWDTAPASKWMQIVERVSDRLRGTPTTPETRFARSVQTLENRIVVEPLKKTALIRWLIHRVTRSSQRGCCKRWRRCIKRSTLQYTVQLELSHSSSRRQIATALNWPPRRQS